jgi:hypothetical protein
MIPNQMIPRYVSELRIEPGADPVATATDVFERIERWIGEVVDRGPLRIPRDGGTIEPGFGCRVGLRLDEDRGGWHLDFRREEAWGAVVETRVRLRVLEDGLDLALLEVSDREPTWRLVRPPGFLPDLLAAYPSSAAGIDWPAEPTNLSAPAVEDFAEEMVLAPERTLPLVAVSVDDYKGETLVDPETLARRLAGLARVFVLEDRSASLALTRALGSKELGCYLGAVRLYLPGFSQDGNPREHLLLLPNQLRFRNARANSAGDQLLAEAMSRFPAWYTAPGPLSGLLSGISLRPPKVGAGEPVACRREAEPEREVGGPAQVIRLTRPPRPPSLDEEPPRNVLGLLPWAKQVKEERDFLLARNEELERRAEDAEEERALFAEEVDSLEEQLAAANDRTFELENRLADAKQEAADLRFMLEKLRQVHPELFEEPPDTVLEAVCRVAAMEDPALLFLPSAFASAEDSPYMYPDKVLSALQALAEVAGKRRKTAESGEGMGTWPVHLFESRGIRYAAHNAATTKARWANEYRIQYNGRRVDLDEHLTLGSSRDPAVCLRIYFFWDDEKKVAVVAHVGRHKRNKLS